MAKHRRRRKFRRYIKGRIDFELALLTLGPNDVLSGVESQSLSETAFLSSIKATWSLGDFTPDVGDGPMWCGVAHSDYTAAEIEEWIEEGASWNEGDMVAKEVARRRIRQVGVFKAEGSGGNVVVLNEGRSITTKCKWSLITGQTIRFWIYNSGSGTLVTGSILHVNGHANLWPN